MANSPTPFTQTPRPKVFCMNEADWWAGYDLQSTMLAFAKDFGFSTIAEAEAKVAIDQPYELNESEMDEELFEGVTFRAALAQLVTNSVTLPCFLGSPLVGAYHRNDVQTRLAA